MFLYHELRHELSPGWRCEILLEGPYPASQREGSSWFL